MQIIVGFSTVIAGILTFVYLYALYRFHGIVQQERPDLVDKRGSLSFFYTGLPRASDPNVGMAALRVAFSRTARELKHPDAARYASRVRWTLCLALPLYVIMFVGSAVGAP